jgi:hypothetical protein
MTQVLLSSSVAVDGVSYSSGDLVDFPASTAAALIGASLGAAQPAPNGRTISHAARAAGVRASGGDAGTAALRLQSLASYAFSEADLMPAVVAFSSGSAVTATVLDGVFHAGNLITVLQLGAGAVTIAAGSGVTLNHLSGVTLAMAGQYSVCQIIMTAPNAGVVFGGLAAA